MRSDGGIKPAAAFWKNGAHSGAFFYFTPLSLFSVLSCFRRSSWRQPALAAGVFKANTASNHELQVQQTCKQALITRLRGHGETQLTFGSISPA